MNAKKSSSQDWLGPSSLRCTVTSSQAISSFLEFFLHSFFAFPSHLGAAGHFTFTAAKLQTLAVIRSGPMDVSRIVSPT